MSLESIVPIFLIVSLGVFIYWIVFEMKKSGVNGLLLGFLNIILLCVIVAFFTSILCRVKPAYNESFSTAAIRSVLELSQTKNVNMVEKAVNEFSQTGNLDYNTRIIVLTTKLHEIKNKNDAESNSSN